MPTIATSSSKLSPNWDTINRRLSIAATNSERYQIFIDQAAKEMIDVVHEQLDLMIYKAHVGRARSGRFQSPGDTERTHRTYDAVKKVAGRSGLATTVGAGPTFSATVAVDPGDFVGMAYYPEFLNKGTVKMAARPFWRNSVIIMQARARAISQRSLVGIKHELTVG